MHLNYHSINFKIICARLMSIYLVHFSFSFETDTNLLKVSLNYYIVSLTLDTRRIVVLYYNIVNYAIMHRKSVDRQLRDIYNDI